MRHPGLGWETMEEAANTVSNRYRNQRCPSVPDGARRAETVEEAEIVRLLGVRIPGRFSRETWCRRLGCPGLGDDGADTAIWSVRSALGWETTDLVFGM